MRTAKAADLQRAGAPQQIRQARLRHIHLALVHEFDDRLQLPHPDLGREYDDWMAVRIVGQHRFKQRRAGGQHQAMALDVLRAAH